MSKNEIIEKVIIFLIMNGWDEDLHADNYRSFFHPRNYGIDIDKKTGEIIILGEEGILNTYYYHEQVFIRL